MLHRRPFPIPFLARLVYAKGMDRNDKRLRASNPPARVKAEFREMARDIIAKDRMARKLGRSQDTISEIARAIAKGYALGQEAMLAGDAKREEALEWIDVPPRARDVLSAMTFRMSRIYRGPDEPGDPDTGADQIEVFEALKGKRWALVHDNVRSQHSFADSSVSALRRLDLLGPVTGVPGRYELTEAGMRICGDYWVRSDAGDQSLPRHGMR
jgi:hypothetical protein